MDREGDRRTVFCSRAKAGRSVFKKAGRRNSTPSIQKDDILVIGSGTGNTKIIIVLAQEAKEYGATVALVSGSTPEDSVIGNIADINLTVPKAAPSTFKKFAVLLHKYLLTA